MNNDNILEEEECIECFKIQCRGCGWEPTDEQLKAVQAGKLTSCPECGWIPGK